MTTKSQITQRLTELHPKTRKSVMKTLTNTLFDYLAKSLSLGKRIEVRGFGSFCLKHRKAGTVRNPRHGISITSGERYVIYFRASKELAKRVDIQGNSNIIPKKCG